MRRSSLAVHVVLLVVSIVASTALVQAQYGASLQGTVSDKSGAVVAGATVAITNQATGVVRSTPTGDSGLYLNAYPRCSPPAIDLWQDLTSRGDAPHCQIVRLRRYCKRCPR